VTEEEKGSAFWGFYSANHFEVQSVLKCTVPVQLHSEPAATFLEANSAQVRVAAWRSFVLIFEEEEKESNLFSAAI
jgi:hypothetical protein